MAVCLNSALHFICLRILSTHIRNQPGKAHCTARSIACCVVAVVSSDERSIICCSMLCACGSADAMRANFSRLSVSASPSDTARHWLDRGLRSTKSSAPSTDPGPACASLTLPCTLGVVACHASAWGVPTGLGGMSAARPPGLLGDRRGVASHSWPSTSSGSGALQGQLTQLSASGVSFVVTCAVLRAMP